MAPVFVARTLLSTKQRIEPARVQPQPIPQLLRRESRHANDFVAAGLAGRNGNGRSGHLQKFCEEFDAGFVGAAFDGRSGQGDFQRIAEFAGDGVLLRAGMNLDGESDTVGISRTMNIIHHRVTETQSKP